MSTQEMLQFQLSVALNQLQKALEGVGQEAQGTKDNPQGFTTLETLGHLCETYTACAAAIRGEKHAWGSYQAPGSSFDELYDSMMDLRARAVEAILADGSDRAFKLATDYILLHDAYHVGQLCSIRLKCEPNWDSDVVYH